MKMATKSTFLCCKNVSAEDLSFHIRSLAPDQLSEHLKQGRLLVDLLFNRLQDVLVHREKCSLPSENIEGSDDDRGSVGGDIMHHANHDSDDGPSHVEDAPVNAMEGNRENNPYKPSRSRYRCKYGCRRFPRRQELVRHYLRRTLPYSNPQRR
jgi:hypothetical protein